MDINDLKVGVVILRLRNGQDMAVRAEDIRSVARANEVTRRAYIEQQARAEQQRAEAALQMRLLEAQMAIDMTLTGGLLGAGNAALQGQVINRMPGVIRAGGAQMYNNALTQTMTQPMANIDAVYVRLSFRPDDLTVTNTYEEIEGWMRNS